MSIEHGSFAQPISVGWAKVFGEIQKTTRICMHDRAGLGSSDKAATPRTSQDMVKDLRSLLRKAQIAPPYVLVGHSIGGFNVRLFANQNPDEVLGMVLVDSSHPNQWRLRTLPHGTDPSFLSDGIDIRASAEQVRATHTLGTKPLVVLTQSPRALRPPGLPPDISDKMRIAWAELQVDLLNLSANSSHVIASHAGHLIQLDEPQLVIDAILKVVHEARAKRPYVH
jgi:pimeloyl-ACP methyl ester carboxylesterase